MSINTYDKTTSNLLYKFYAAEADVDGQNKIQEDTAGDISVMEGLDDGKHDELPQDHKKGEE
jgi:hypothetical protein